MSSDTNLHVKLSKEKATAAHHEFNLGRHAVVGDLAIKAVEQAIEAAASLEGKHFHIQPRRAHIERLAWAKTKFPEISSALDELWGACGALGYEGIDGDRAKKALNAMKKAIGEIAKGSKLDLT